MHIRDVHSVYAHGKSLTQLIYLLNGAFPLQRKPIKHHLIGTHTFDKMTMDKRRTFHNKDEEKTEKRDRETMRERESM